MQRVYCSLVCLSQRIDLRKFVAMYTVGCLTVIAYTMNNIHTVRTLDLISRMHHTMVTSILLFAPFQLHRSCFTTCHDLLWQCSIQRTNQNPSAVRPLSMIQPFVSVSISTALKLTIVSRATVITGDQQAPKSKQSWPDTRKHKMIPLFLDLHDAYLLCSCEQLDCFATCGEWR